ncbi:C4b-binding protein alpha chain-like isoform X8 [Sparus aurata]|uniref:C4b-binding protein alpha chain-like isoform X8 n=1 Tax=Sparus aurata TaxID=8175 RepID=UPI0011C0DAA1|nr:C4b-binding protein alpha chain-like isoform X8 [Sparus aurata]
MAVNDFLLLSCLGFAITAHAQDCARPSGGPNMHLKDEHTLKETFADGDQAAFECDTGYTSTGGSSSITCTAGSWSAVMLKCQRRSCGSPGELLNGYIDYPKENLFGDHIEITCNQGYRMVGKSTIVCGAAGWLDRLPRCEVVTCDEAPQVKDATFTPYKDSYDFGDVVQYSCRTGLTLNGSASISCSDDGTFKPAPPTCTMMTCNRPLPLEHGSFSPVKASYTYKDVVQYSCQTGFKLSGTNSVSCSDDGTFKPEPPTCTKFIPPPQPDIYCEVPHVEHGYLVHDDRPLYRPNDKVTFKCRSFYDMEGDSTLTCQADGQWSPPPPKCAYSHGKVAGVVVGVIVLVVAGAAGAAIYKKKKKQRFRKNNNGNSTNDKGGKSVGDAVGLMETPTGNGQTTEDKLPVGSANEV